MDGKKESFGELRTVGRSGGTRREVASEAEARNQEGTIGNFTTRWPDGILDDGRTDGRRSWKTGEEILGRYVVERELGQGGMEVVYECQDMVGGVKVAVKRLSSGGDSRRMGGRTSMRWG